jgi:uncharacterized protein (DUF4415 family)
MPQVQIQPGGDALAWFRAAEVGYQPRINAALRE